MHRRFGPPNLAGGFERHLSGGWLVGTPHPDLYLFVLPCVCTPAYSFEPLVTRAAEAEARRGGGIQEKLAGAYLKAMLDLLRPVPVRASLINALGKVERGDPLREEGRLEVTPEPASCHAMPPGFADRWGRAGGPRRAPRRRRRGQGAGRADAHGRRGGHPG